MVAKKDSKYARFLPKQGNQKCTVGGARQRANSGEYETTASLLLNSWAVVAWILVYTSSII